MIATLAATAYAAGLGGYVEGHAVVLRLRACDRAMWRARSEEDLILLLGYLVAEQRVDVGEA